MPRKVSCFIFPHLLRFHVAKQYFRLAKSSREAITRKCPENSFTTLPESTGRMCQNKLDTVAVIVYISGNTSTLKARLRLQTSKLLCESHRFAWTAGRNIIKGAEAPSWTRKQSVFPRGAFLKRFTTFLFIVYGFLYEA